MTEGDAPKRGQLLYWPKNIFSFEGYVVLLNAAGTILIFAIMAMICSDITARYVFDHPLRGVTELTETSIVGIVFLQLPHAVRLGKLTRSDGAYNFLLTRTPRFGRLLAAFYDLAAVTLLGIIAIGSIPKLMLAWNDNYFLGNIGIFTFPEWPSWLVLIIGAGTTALQFLAFAIQHVRGAFADEPDL